MTVCVGDRPFNEFILGTNRDQLRNCIDDELNKLMEPYGLAVANVTLSEEVKGLLDAITKSRLETEKALQKKLKAEAKGTACQAQQEAKIRGLLLPTIPIRGNPITSTSTLSGSRCPPPHPERLANWTDKKELTAPSLTRQIHFIG
jgi:hypothetical protein